MKRLMDEKTEDMIIDFLLKQAAINELTISHIQKIADKTIQYMKDNAVLKEKVESLVDGKLSMNNKKIRRSDTDKQSQ
nr:MAG TPA: hypothetical protein [Caudoviricetes sp.]